MQQDVRRGDRSAVSRAYEAPHAPTRAFAQRLVGAAAPTEDIVHDTFVALPSRYLVYMPRGDGVGISARIEEQGFAAVFIESLSGSYSGVMGLPLFETSELLRAAGVPSWCTMGA